MSVYTVVSQGELVEFLKDYDVGALLSFEGISAGIENTNYFVNTERDGRQLQFVLTIFEHHTFDELPYFLNIMAFMAEHKIPTAHPIQTLSNGYLKELKGKPAALVERLKGGGVEQPSLKQCEVMGEQLARFHLAGQDFSGFRQNDRGLDWMKTTLALVNDFFDAEQKQMVKEEFELQSGIDWHSLPQGVIHADLFCDNALFSGDELSGIIDLYYACNSVLLYDLAVMVNDWCRINSTDPKQIVFDQHKIDAMLQAYRSVRPLNALEQQSWNAALRLAALRFFMSRSKDKYLPREGEMTQIKDPAVFERILQIHRS
ncbi:MULTISPECIES: homoserine kinase [Thiomicrorhabdus]|uniref:Homoserine kinase n=1 Tax=Thiomicrorhabdus heinhorstiae TaxID=2748010 RepID=A0ABS0C0U1_9GAMM|nr:MULTISPECIES: homoserine kinase [Thiomicrorhabdus]MBF6058910.1 homoserine kinase [Thiomicrorhabdus heinhorstiae]